MEDTLICRGDHENQFEVYKTSVGIYMVAFI